MHLEFQHLYVLRGVQPLVIFVINLRHVHLFKTVTLATRIILSELTSPPKLKLNEGLIPAKVHAQIPGIDLPISNIYRMEDKIT